MVTMEQTLSLPYVDKTALLALLPLVSVFVIWVLPYLVDKYGLRRYPGPLLAKVSAVWLSSKAHRGATCSAVHAMHEKFGKYLYPIYNL